MKAIICLLFLCATIFACDVEPLKADDIMQQLGEKWSAEKEVLYQNCIEAIQVDLTFPRKIKAPIGMPAFIVEEICRRINTAYETSPVWRWDIEAVCLIDYSRMSAWTEDVAYAIRISLQRKPLTVEVMHDPEEIDCDYD